MPDHEDDSLVLNDFEDKMSIEDPSDRSKLAQLGQGNNGKDKKRNGIHSTNVS